MRVGASRDARRVERAIAAGVNRGSVARGLPRLHAITDDAVLASADFGKRAPALLDACGGALALHLRGHATRSATLFGLARSLRPVAERSGALLVVNDRVDVALAAGLDGVQLGRRSLPVEAARALLGAGACIGYSAHGAGEAGAAADAGADWLLVGTIYETRSHAGEPGAGVGRIRGVVAAVDVPVFAIGGITPERVAAVRGAGAYGVAVLGGIWHEGDGVAAARRYLAALEEEPG